MTTFLDILTEIKNHLLGQLPIFHTGYAYARQDTSKGLIVTSGNESSYISLNDVEGDYFYIRFTRPSTGTISSSSAPSRSDCSGGILQKCSCSLVAIATDADEFRLTDALTNELMKTKLTEIKSIWIDPVAIVNDEFSGMNTPSLNSVKSKIGERTIARVDFDIVRHFQTHNCSYQICTTCSH